MKMGDGAFSRTGLQESRLQQRERPRQLSVELVCAGEPVPAALRPFSLLRSPYRWPCSLLCRHPARPTAPSQSSDSGVGGGAAALRPLMPSLPAYRADPAAAAGGAAYELGALLTEELLRRYAASESSLLEARQLEPHRRGGPAAGAVTGQRAVVILDLRGDLDRLLSVPTTAGERTGSRAREPLRPPALASSSRRLAAIRGGAAALLTVHTLRPLPLRSRSTSSGSMTRRSGAAVTPRRRRRRRRRSLSPQRPPSDETETLLSRRPGHLLPAAAASDQICITVPDMAELVPAGEHKPKKKRKHKRGRKGKGRGKKKKSKLDPRLQQMEAFSTMMGALQSSFSGSRGRAKATTEKRFNQQLEQAMAEYCDPEEPDLFWLRLPRSFATRSCRFELPTDLRLLETLSPLQYLADYTVISRAREFVYAAAYGRHRQEGGVPAEAVWGALEEAAGGQLGERQRAELLQLLAEPLPELLSRPQLSGLAALCERLFAPELSPAAAQTGGGGRERLEEVDFQRLAVLLEGVPNPRDDVTALLWRIRDEQ